MDVYVDIKRQRTRNKNRLVVAEAQTTFKQVVDFLLLSLVELEGEQLKLEVFPFGLLDEGEFAINSAAKDGRVVAKTTLERERKMMVVGETRGGGAGGEEFGELG